MIAFILSGELIAKTLDIHFELVCDHLSSPRIVILSVVSRPRIGSSMRQFLSDPEPLRDKRPVLVESFEFSNEIGEDIPVRIDKPIQLITMRRRMDARAAAILNPIDKFLESHFVSEL